MMQELYERLKQIFPLGELTEQRPDLAFLTLDREQLRPLLLSARALHVAETCNMPSKGLRRRRLKLLRGG